MRQRDLHDVDVVVAMQGHFVSHGIVGHLVYMVRIYPCAASVRWMEANEIKFQADRAYPPVLVRAVESILKGALLARHPARTE